MVKIVDFTCISLLIVDLSKMNCILLTNFVDVDFWQNIDVECKPEAEQIVDLHLARTPPQPPQFSILMLNKHMLFLYIQIFETFVTLFALILLMCF